MASANPLESAQEAQQMLVAYAKQETIDPLKDLGRYLAWGIGGAVAIFVGVLFLSLGLLRGLQRLEPFDAEDGLLTTLPYVITVAALLLVMGLIYLLFSRAKKRVLR